jgi:hypothetical protein
MWDLSQFLFLLFQFNRLFCASYLSGIPSDWCGVCAYLAEFSVTCLHMILNCFWLTWTERVDAIFSRASILNAELLRLRSPQFKTNKKHCVARVRKRTIPTQRSPFVGEVSANFLRIEGCHVVSTAYPYGRNLGFIDPSRYIFFQVAHQLYSRGWVDHVPDLLLFRKSGSSGNRTRTSGSVVRNSDQTLSTRPQKWSASNSVNSKLLFSHRIKMAETRSWSSFYI